ncbi:MAG: ribosomal protein S18-alanine N-acetyltransferase [Deltaproteobacteria bacterium]|nr:ribosomal protein S18-alanine N-acetyltransferase [Deltaproteobacteria bacterium]
MKQDTSRNPAREPDRTEDREVFLKLFQVKTATKADLSQMLHLERRCHCDPWTRENYLYELSREVTFFRGLYRRATLVGLTVSWIIPPECHLLNVMILPDLWGHGLGKTLMEDLVALCRSNSASQVLLEVRSDNFRAKKLYRGLGFKRDGLRLGYYGDGTDAVLMSLHLPVNPGAPLERTKRRPIGDSNSPRTV